MTALTRSPGIRGKHVLLAMLAFFFVVIAVNAGFIIVALRSFPGEDEKRSYLQGLHYNKILDSRAAQAQLGWTAEARLAPPADSATKSVLVVFDVRDRHGAPVEGLHVTGALRRPATTREDQALAFKEIGRGLYQASVGDIENGAWVIQGEARRGTETFAFERRLTWSRTPR